MLEKYIKFWFQRLEPCSKMFLFGYFQVFSKDEKTYSLNQFLVADSIRFMHLCIFIRPSFLFL